MAGYLSAEHESPLRFWPARQTRALRGQLFNMTTDQVLGYDGKVPAEVVIEDKSVIEKMALVDQLEEKEKTAFFSILDALVSKKRLKDSLSNALNALNLA
jgi:hypothetical protein